MTKPRSPSGKPQLDEKAIDAGWEAQEPEKAPAPGTPARPAFGTGVPYAGDDKTEEVEPIALDMPFASDDAAPAEAPAPSAPAETAAAARPARPAEPPAPPSSSGLAAPAAHVVLSDLFDSTPPESSSLEPPDPTAFSSSRPPRPKRSSLPAWARIPGQQPPPDDLKPKPASGAPPHPRPNPAARSEPPASKPAVSKPPASGPAGGALVAIPSISVTSDAGSPASPSSRPPPSAKAEAPADLVEPAVEAAEPAPPAPPAVAPAPAAPELGAVVPSSPAPVAEPLAPATAAPELGAVVPSSPAPVAEPLTPATASPDSPADDATAGGDPEPTPDARPKRASVPTLESVASFPSDVPTRRPPDVESVPPAAAPESHQSMGLPSETAAPVVSAPPPSSRSNGPLPSVMLAPDVEQEAAEDAGRSLRAGKQTVRIELPPGFGQQLAPGGPLRPGAPVASGHPAAATPAAAARTTRSSASPAWLWWVVAGLLLTAVAVLLFPELDTPTTGSLVVTARGPGNRPVDDVQIFVDDREPCEVSPCKIDQLAAGEHRIRVTAADLESADEMTVSITAGSEAVVNVELSRSEPEVTAGAMRVAAGASAMTLFVDGRRVGKLPQTVPGLSGGKHWVKLVPDDPETGGRVIEKAVIIEAGVTVDVAPVAAKSDKVLVTIVLAEDSEGASVTLDDAFLLDFPAELELDPTRVHTLVASKPGFEDFRLDIELDADETARTVEVDLSRAHKAKRRSRRKSTKKSRSAADPTQGLLNISSIPPAQVILNGRPLGKTPKRGVVVPGDSLQTIVFVHPTMGRRRAQKFVPAGKKRTVAIRF